MLLSAAVAPAPAHSPPPNPHNFLALAGSLAGQLQLIALEQQSFLAGDFKTSVAISTALLNAPSNSVKTNLYIRRAMAHLEQHRYQDALDDAEQALALAQTNARAHVLAGYAAHGLASVFLAQKALEKVVNRACLALAYLHKAVILDPSLAGQAQYQKALQSCYAIVSSPPILSSDENLLSLRASELASISPTLSDGAYFKAEMLLFLASLNRRCLQTSEPLVQSIVSVRSFAEMRQALIKIESRFSYDIQLASWKSDRAAWMHGVSLASSAGELYVCLRGLRASMRRSLFATAPDIFMAQIRAVANDLDAYGDAGLGCAHRGEYREIYLALVSQGIETVGLALSAGLRIAKARCLLAMERPGEALNVLSGALGLSLSKVDTDAVVQLRDQALAKIPDASQAAAAAAAAPVASTLEHPTAPSPPPLPAPASPFDASVLGEEALAELLPEQREHLLAVPALALERALGSIRHRALPLAQEHVELLNLYSHPSQPAPPTEPVGSLNHNALADQEEVLASVHAMAQTSPPNERDGWVQVESALSRALKVVKAVMTEHLGAAPEPLQLPVAPVRSAESKQPDTKSRRAVEKSLLMQRCKTPGGNLDHQDVICGWTDDSTSLWFGPAEAVEDDDPEDDPRSGFLLFEDVYFVPSATNTESWSPALLLPMDVLTGTGGTFVCEACAKVCHATSPSFLVGRAPLSSRECGALCHLRKAGGAELDAPSSLQVQSVAHEVIRVALSQPNAVAGLKRQAELQPAMTVALAGLDDESSLLRHYLKARDECGRCEGNLAMHERLKWAFEQLIAAHRWTHQVHRALARRMDPTEVRQGCEFLRKTLKLLEVLKLVKGEAIHALLGGAHALADLTQALTVFDQGYREHIQIGVNRDEMVQSLAKEEERRLQASSSLVHPPAEIGLVQQQLSDEFDSLSASVFSKHQQLALLETRLADAHAAVASQSQLLLRRFGAKCCDAARDILFCVATVDPSLVSLACAETGVPQAEKLTVLWRSEAPPEDMLAETRARVDAFSRRLKSAPEDTLDQLARAAASTLACWPAKLTSEADDFEAVLQPVDLAAEEIKRAMWWLFEHHLVQQKHASAVFPSRNFNPLQALQAATSTWNRARQENVDAQARQRWRRAELFRFVHVRNQLLLSALASSVLAELASIRAGSDMLASTLLADDEHESMHRKSRRRHKRKPVSAAAGDEEPEVPKAAAAVAGSKIPTTVAVAAAPAEDRAPSPVALPPAVAKSTLPPISPVDATPAAPVVAPGPSASVVASHLEPIPSVPVYYDDMPEEQKEAEWVVVSRTAKRSNKQRPSPTAAAVAAASAATAAAAFAPTPSFADAPPQRSNGKSGHRSASAAAAPAPAAAAAGGRAAQRRANDSGNSANGASRRSKNGNVSQSSTKEVVAPFAAAVAAASTKGSRPSQVPVSEPSTVGMPSSLSLPPEEACADEAKPVQFLFGRFGDEDDEEDEVDQQEATKEPEAYDDASTPVAERKEQSSSMSTDASSGELPLVNGNGMHAASASSELPQSVVFVDSQHGMVPPFYPMAVPPGGEHAPMSADGGGSSETAMGDEPPMYLVPPPPPILMPPMRPICPYFAQGMCRFGQRCRDVHMYPMFPPPVYAPQPPPSSLPWEGNQ